MDEEIEDYFSTNNTNKKRKFGEILLSPHRNDLNSNTVAAQVGLHSIDTQILVTARSPMVRTHKMTISKFNSKENFDETVNLRVLGDSLDDDPHSNSRNDTITRKSNKNFYVNNNESFDSSEEDQDWVDVRQCSSGETRQSGRGGIDDIILDDHMDEHTDLSTNESSVLFDDNRSNYSLNEFEDCVDDDEDDDHLTPIHPDSKWKIMWDICTIFLSLTVGVYSAHESIKNRSFKHSDVPSNSKFMFVISVFGKQYNVLLLLIEIWFMMDLILNFYTKIKLWNGEILSGRAARNRYLKTWFVIDAASLVPWERVLIQPIIDMQNRRNWFVKLKFRSRSVMKAVPRITRYVKRRANIKIFGKAAKVSGLGARRLIGKLIKYIPKYLLFYRSMKGALIIRMLRLFHWTRKVFKTFRKSLPTRAQIRQIRLVRRRARLNAAAKKTKNDCVENVAIEVVFVDDKISQLPANPCSDTFVEGSVQNIMSYSPLRRRRRTSHIPNHSKASAIEKISSVTIVRGHSLEIQGHNLEHDDKDDNLVFFPYCSIQ